MLSMTRLLSPFRALWSASRRTVTAGLDELFPSHVEHELEAARESAWQIDSSNSYCHRCGASTGSGEVTVRGCSRCSGMKLAWDHLVRLSLYKPPVSSWIVAMKFHRQWPWAPWIGRALAAQVNMQANAQASDRKPIVCAVPSPRVRQWRRGFSHTHLMAQAFAGALNWRVVNLLHRRGWQQPQTRVLAAHRALNVRDAFRVDEVDLTGCEVWLIDDVKTTGATLSACAKLLRQAGAAKINVAVGAAADPDHADFKLK